MKGKATTRPKGLLRRRLTISRVKPGSRLRRKQRMKCGMPSGILFSVFLSFPKRMGSILKCRLCLHLVCGECAWR